MATMPDLNLNEVGVMAYWNIEDAGEDPETVNWGEMASAFDEYTIYDNGIIGTMENYDGTDNDFITRAKSDGWVVTYVGDSLSEESHVGAWDWLRFRQSEGDQLATVAEDSNLHNAMQAATTELSESPTILAEDIKYYSPLHSPATACSYAGVLGTSSDDEDWIEFTVTDNVTIEAAYFVAGRYVSIRFTLEDVTNNEEILYFSDDPTHEPETAIVTSDIEPGNQYYMESEPTSVSGEGAAYSRIWWW